MEGHPVRDLLVPQPLRGASLVCLPKNPLPAFTSKPPSNTHRNGVFGGIHINGPASAPYNHDLGVLLLSDWTHETTDVLWEKARTDGSITLNTGLINGTNNFNGTGSRHEMFFTPNEAHRIRLINTALDTHWAVTLDKHTMKVIAADFVSIDPFETEVLSIGIGQRYDVIINATDAAKGDYWFRAIPQTACSSHEQGDNIKSIVRYSRDSHAEPGTTVLANVPADCLDVPVASLVPSLRLDAGEVSIKQTKEFALDVPEGVWKWKIDGESFYSDWGYPSEYSS